MDEMLPLATKSIKKEDRIKKHALNETSFWKILVWTHKMTDDLVSVLLRCID